jgi:succinate dehydrogenase/fumarate reductase flavoprotein subunit
MSDADVLVLGAGPGGMATALEAARAGAHVVVLEATDAIGGNAARSTGYLSFVDFPMQHAAGIVDSPEALLQDMLAEVARQQDRYGLLFDLELARLFAQESLGLWDYLTELGFRFHRFIRRPLQHTTDRMVDVEDTTMFRTCFERAFGQAGVEVRYGTRATRLVREGGRVTGVTVAGHGEGTLRASSAVVLATGGYQANPALRHRYQPGYLASTPYLGLDTCRGDGHVLGQALGGDLINMTMIPALVMVGSALVEDGIAVNLDGTRFHDEAGPYDDRVDALLAQPQRLAFYVCDGRAAQRRRMIIEQMPEPPVTAGSLTQLADTIGCDAEALRGTVNRWNAAVEAQVDTELGRVILPGPDGGIVEPPFHAMRMVLGVNFPSGGFRVTTSMQVLDVFDRPIEGLLAVGDCVGGVSPAVGLGGMHISPALALGRVAGRAAVSGAGASPSVARPHEPAGLLTAEPPPMLPGTTLPIVDLPAEAAR